MKHKISLPFIFKLKILKLLNKFEIVRYNVRQYPIPNDTDQR